MKSQVVRAFRTVELPPYFCVLPADGEVCGRSDDSRIIRIRDRGAFGNGTHETTQLCLLALGYLLRARSQPANVLDVGAGAGVLAIGAALRGAIVDAVEIDPVALESAKENIHLNGVDQTVRLNTVLREPPQAFDVVVANILAGVLLDLAEPLCRRVASSGHLVLSGLLGTDVPAVVARYLPLLTDKRVGVHERGLWRAVVFSPDQRASDDRAGAADEATEPRTSRASRIPS